MVSPISRYSNWTVAFWVFPLAWYLARMARASSLRSLESSHLGDSGIQKMKMIWIREGTIWMRVIDLHDQSLATYEVPQPMNVQTVLVSYEGRIVSQGGYILRFPKFQRQL